MTTRDDVRHIAALARIHLEDHELESLSRDLENILHYVKNLEKCDVTSVAPRFHRDTRTGTGRVLAQKNVTRRDIVKPSLKQEDALRIAVAKHNGFFKVPLVIE